VGRSFFASLLCVLACSTFAGQALAQSNIKPMELAFLDLKPDTNALSDFSNGERFLQGKRASPSMLDAITFEFQQWRGTPYRLGGTDERGIDCSALVREIFSKGLQIDLPRSSGEQLREGEPINKAELKIGDLVFFNSGRTGRHVGIYLGDNRFVHASSLLGVTISSLEENYWKKRYITARRIAEVFAR